MGKSSKLFKTLLAGVKAFKSPSKEKSTNVESSTHGSKREERDQPQCKNGIPPFITAAGDEGSPAQSVGVVVVTGKGYSGGLSRKDLSVAVDESQREEWAAAKIQAAFRCYLAQRAFRALKALVRLQALARGRFVRKQAASTLRCIQALVRVQAHVRGSRVRTSELGQLVQKHLQQARQQRRKVAEGWNSSTSTLKELQAKAQSKQEAVMKRQRALVYSFSEQLRRSAPKQSSLIMDCEPDRNDRGWMWLERWMAARPWENSPKEIKEQLSFMTVPAKNEKSKIKPESDKHKGSAKKEYISGSGLLTVANKSPRASVIQEEHTPSPPTLPSVSRAVSVGVTKTTTGSATLQAAATRMMVGYVTSPSASGVSLPTTPSSTQPAVGTSPDKSVTLGTLHTQLDLSSPVSSAIPMIPSFSSQQSKVSSTLFCEEQRSPHQQQSTSPPLSTPDAAFTDMANGAVTSEENASGINRESDLRLMNDEEYPVDGEPHLGDDMIDIVEPEINSQQTGTCSPSVKLGSPKGSEISNKRNTAAKHDQGECSSPSVPNYMAKTQSSKAKVRPLNSPKQKTDPVSPSTKKRQSLPGSEAKSSPATQRHTSHVRAGSKGQLPSLRDGSENSPIANGDPWRYGK